MFQVIINTTGQLKAKDIKDTSAIDAIETIYNFHGDEVIFQWGDIQFVASLHSDISDSWFDIIGLMKNLKSKKSEFTMQFPSQGFWHYWEFKEVEKHFWEIEAFWSHHEKAKIKVEKTIFQQEFQKLISKVETDLKAQDYKLEEFREYS